MMSRGQTQYRAVNLSGIMGKSRACSSGPVATRTPAAPAPDPNQPHAIDLWPESAGICLSEPACRRGQNGRLHMVVSSLRVTRFPRFTRPFARTTLDRHRAKRKPTSGLRRLLSPASGGRKSLVSDPVVVEGAKRDPRQGADHIFLFVRLKQKNGFYPQAGKLSVFQPDHPARISSGSFPSAPSLRGKNAEGGQIASGSAEQAVSVACLKGPSKWDGFWRCTTRR